MRAEGVVVETPPTITRSLTTPSSITSAQITAQANLIFEKPEYQSFDTFFVELESPGWPSNLGNILCPTELKVFHASGSQEFGQDLAVEIEDAIQINVQPEPIEQLDSIDLAKVLYLPGIEAEERAIVEISECGEVVPEKPIEAEAITRAILAAMFRNTDSSTFQGFAWPTDYLTVTSCPQDERTVLGETKPHLGVDIRGWNPGVVGSNSDVYAVLDGEIVQVIDSCFEGETTCGGGFGNSVVLKLDIGGFVRYSHLESIQVKEDQKVAKKETIAVAGNTGSSTAIHLDVRYYPGDTEIQYASTYYAGRDNTANPLCLFSQNNYSVKDSTGCTIISCPTYLAKYT